jgi:V/A-type H+-transporting ATPase subunit I
MVTLLWSRLSRSATGRRVRNLAVALSGASLAWGIAVGSYFGMAPPTGSWLARVHLIDASSTDRMMSLAVSVGVAHLVIANLAAAWTRRATLQAWVPLGWIAILLAGTLLWFGVTRDLGWLRQAAAALGGAGAAAILICSSNHPNPLHRLLDGLLGLTRISGVFGDVLSYLRLFALGFAGGSLAGAFNQLAGLAGQMNTALGALPAIGVLLVGHGLNFLLGVTGGVVHGLRLNYIEFFNWGLGSEGYPFRPLARKERSA